MSDAHASDRDAMARTLLPRLSRWFGRIRRRNPWLADEFESAALVGLAEALAASDGMNLTPDAAERFTARIVHRAVVTALRDWMPRGYRSSYRGEGRAERTLTPLPLNDAVVAARTTPVGSELEAADAIASLTSGLPELHAKALLIYYAHPEEPRGRRFAELMGVSQTRAAGLRAEAESMIAGQCGEPAPVRVPVKFGPDDADLLRKLAAANPGFGLPRLARLFEAETGRPINTGTAWGLLRKTFAPSRSEHRVEWKGKTLSISGWAGVTGIPAATLTGRLKRGWPPDLALTVPATSTTKLKTLLRNAV